MLFGGGRNKGELDFEDSSIRSAGSLRGRNRSIHSVRSDEKVGNGGLRASISTPGNLWKELQDGNGKNTRKVSLS